MDCGVSIFFEFHEQGCPHIIAGIYSPKFKSEENMRNDLLKFIGQNKFEDHDTIKYFNHTHIYAYHLLDNEMTNDELYTFSRFFPKALEPEILPVSAFKFYYTGENAETFIWHNRYHKELDNYLYSLMLENSK